MTSKAEAPATGGVEAVRESIPFSAIKEAASIAMVGAGSDDVSDTQSPAKSNGPVAHRFKRPEFKATGLF